MFPLTLNLLPLQKTQVYLDDRSSCLWALRLRFPNEHRTSNAGSLHRRGTAAGVCVSVPPQPCFIRCETDGVREHAGQHGCLPPLPCSGPPSALCSVAGNASWRKSALTSTSMLMSAPNWRKRRGCYIWGQLGVPSLPATPQQQLPQPLNHLGDQLIDQMISCG